MGKKDSDKGEKDNALDNLQDEIDQDIPNEALEKLEDIRGKLEDFKKKVLSKFEDYVVGISLLPPSKEKGEEDKINILLLIDDQDSEKMSKSELKEKLTKIIGKMANDVDKNLSPDVLLLTELWQMCYDGKYDVLETISKSAPVHDTGMLDAIKIAQVHRNMVLEKFEKYIVTYVLAGSLVQGKATHKSDIDVFIVIDDTDVKRMTRAELKDKLRAIIVGMGMDAAEATGIDKHFNIQVYILTDFWDNIKEANPIIFTFLRDGVPFYDRGIFMPWKQLLQMGKIKPSPEAIDMYRSTGDNMITRAKKKLQEIAVEDLFWATITPSQAALMMYGVAPPTPKETPDLLMDLFVKKEDLMEEKHVKMFKRILKTRKDIEHNDKKNVTGKELDSLMKDAEDYLKRIKKMFSEIEELKEKESILDTYDRIVTIVRDVLRLEGIDKVSDDEMIKMFDKRIVQKGILPESYLSMLKDVKKAKKDYDAGKLNKAEVNNAKKQAGKLKKALVEHIQRKRGRELESTRIRVKHGDRFGEIILLGDHAYIIHDIDNEEKEITKANIKKDGSLGKIKSSSVEEMEEALMDVELPEKTFIKEPIFEDLKDIFGKDVEVLINY